MLTTIFDKKTTGITIKMLGGGTKEKPILSELFIFDSANL